MDDTAPPMRDSGNLSVHIPKAMEQVLNPQGQNNNSVQPQSDNMMSNNGMAPMGEPVSQPVITCKHPVMCLNELRKGLNYELLEEFQQGLHKHYRVRVVVDGEPFEATAGSKKLAKQEASKFALLKIFKILYVPEDQMTHEMRQFSEGNNLKRKTTVNVPGQKKKRKLIPRNAVMMLNEFKTGLEFNVLSCTGPVHAPNFIIGVDIDGQRYEGSGKSKKLAKLAAAENALKAFPEKYNQYLEEKSLIDSSTLNAADSTTSSLPSSVTLAQVNNKHPCMALNEIRPGVEYVVVSEQGPPHERQYVLSVTVDGEIFHGSGRSKKLAKHNAAAAAIAHLCRQ